MYSDQEAKTNKMFFSLTDKNGRVISFWKNENGDLVWDNYGDNQDVISARDAKAIHEALESLGFKHDT